ncbi:zinc finger, RING/FYVE/PHD-type [Artemisia annua]|uniref:Zinc finger, RING/FYVE/PHD-type n=1 Tax=Artemisia annua TaxID=35608 RepID=A0A2U1KK98_ARTAN|nr:zinc finger, RING/FYVE/PHD-type [Artemisia annua]
MGPHDPYWRTNTSFSPPPPRWDFRFQNEGQSFGSQEGSRLYGSSTSSNSRESRSWLRGNYVPNHRHSVSVSDGYGAFFSSPSDLSPAQQWSAPIIQEISFDEYNANSSKRGCVGILLNLVTLVFVLATGCFEPHAGSRGWVLFNSIQGFGHKCQPCGGSRVSFTEIAAWEFPEIGGYAITGVRFNVVMSFMAELALDQTTPKTNKKGGPSAVSILWLSNLNPKPPLGSTRVSSKG